MDESLVAFDHVSAARRGYAILKDLSFRLERGEFVGILGPNGAGKTSFLMLVNGLLRPSSGRAYVLGKTLPASRAYLLRRRIGYVAQVENIDPRLPMTVRETVLSGAFGRLGWLRRPRTADYRKVDAALEQVGMTALAGRPIGQLSGGEYQRTAIARVLVQEPELFLFDEPTASIDPRAQGEILRLVRDMHQRSGATALYVTHDLSSLPEACERLVLMKEGLIWREGPRRDMLRDDLLADLYAAPAAGAA